MDTVLWIVIPCYNEEDVLPITSELFLKELSLLIEKEKISSKSRILFINDGSRDKTWEIIKNLAEKDEHYIGICQSRNRGHQNAVLAGLMEAKKYADQYDNIILLRNETNRGLNYTLNRCAQVASGEYFARQDGDDLSLPERFEKEVAIRHDLIQ